MKSSIHNWAAAGLLLAAATGAHAATYTTILTGAKEAPPNTSSGIGAAAVKFDASTHVLEISTAFSGLFGNSTAAHIHCCTTVSGDGTAGVATELPSFSGFPLGVQTGAYSHTFDTSLAATWNPAFLSANGGNTSGAEAALLAGLNAGQAYLNIHSSAYPNGEIRGFLTQAAAVPEPASYAMLGLGLPAVLLMARRRRGKST
jgi:hypothetical protein